MDPSTLSQWVLPEKQREFEENHEASISFLHQRNLVGPASDRNVSGTIANLYALYPLFFITQNYNLCPIVRLMNSRLFYRSMITHTKFSVSGEVLFSRWYETYLSIIPLEVRVWLERLIEPPCLNDLVFLDPSKKDQVPIDKKERFIFLNSQLSIFSHEISRLIWRRFGESLLENSEEGLALSRELFKKIKPYAITTSEIVHPDGRKEILGYEILSNYIESLLTMLRDSLAKRLPLESIASQFVLPSLKIVVKTEEIDSSFPISSPPLQEETYMKYQNALNNSTDLMPLLTDLLDPISYAQAYCTISRILMFLFEQNGFSIYDGATKYFMLMMVIPELNNTFVNLVRRDIVGQYFMSKIASKNYAIDIVRQDISMIGEKINCRAGFVSQPYHLVFDIEPQNPEVPSLYGLIHIFDENFPFLENLHCRYYRNLEDHLIEEFPTYV